jgi:hypothetical protein
MGTPMKRLIAAGSLVALVLTLPLADAGGKKEPKEALQALQDFIGGWKGSGTNVKTNQIWRESIAWSWRFKGKDAWLTVDFENSKLFKHGEMRWLPDKSKYQLTLTDLKDKKNVYEGELAKGVLNLERLDPQTKNVDLLKINTAADGIRLIYNFAQRPEGRTLAFKTYQLGYTKEGESFGGTAANKKPECVVTGGLGTIAVSYMGTTYYVCCSGCRDAFNENPAKIVKEYLAKKKAGR